MNQVQAAAKTSALAIWSLILGILGLLCLGFFAGIPAIICGHMGRSRIKQSQGALKGSGLALAGLIMGYVGAVFVTIGILAAIAIPSFMAYKTKADCTLIELEAKKAMTAVACYMEDPNHQSLPTPDQLASNEECWYQPIEGLDVEIDGTVEQVQVSAIDIAGTCTMGDRYILSMPENISDGWQ